MAIVTVNTGSSSVRLAAFGVDPERGRLATMHAARHDTDPADLLAGFMTENRVPQVQAVVHRVVHGGPRMTAPCVIDDAVEAEIQRLVPLAPLHNPRALEWIDAARRVFGPTPLQVAAFDTALFASLPAVAATYAIPGALQRKYGIRRFGFHGLAHGAMWAAWRELAPSLAEGGRTISLQLGAGCSIAALDCGRPVDTSMGFSPLEGLVMATRCGDLDPGLFAFLCRSEGLAPEALEARLNDESGLLGLSGESAEMRVLLESSSAAARLAIDVYCYRARKYIGAYCAALGGVDGILFGGGVGENAARVREYIVGPLAFLGVALDRDANDAEIGTKQPRCISSESSAVQVWVIPVDEASAMAAAGRERLAALA
jgi:acetate kinase